MQQLPIRHSNALITIDNDCYAVFSRFEWRMCSWGYAVRSTRSNGIFTNIYMHRFLMNIHPGDLQFVDHIDGNKLNNQISNLRIVTRQQNQFNQRINARKHSSKYKGVLWYDYHGTAKWLAGIRFQRKRYHIGLFTNENDAARAYNVKAIELFGEYAQLNIIEA